MNITVSSFVRSMNSKSHPKISVIIPTYNRAQLAVQAINSVLNQTYSNFEVIVVDNFSSDSTKQDITELKDPRIRFFQNKNRGIVAISRNFGIQKSRGEFIAFLDSDDRWTHDKLHISLKKLKDGADLIYHDMYVEKKSKTTLSFNRKIKTRKLKRPIFYDLWEQGNTIPNSSVVVRRSLLTELGGFCIDSDILTAEDYFGWLQLSLHSDKFIKLDETLGFYLAHDENLSNNAGLRLANSTFLRDKFCFGELKCAIPCWMYYKDARAHRALGNNKLFLRNAFCVLKSDKSINLKFKVLVLVVMSFHQQLLEKVIGGKGD